MIKQFWTGLDPQQKRWLLFLVAFSFFAVVTIFSGESKQEEKRGRKKLSSMSLLTKIP
jgi:conjugal transfer pilus assembly protein TraB